MRTVGSVLAVMWLGLPAPLAAQGGFDIQAHYEKHEYQIPMRDGVKLFTSVYAPRDTSRDYPILLERTPYGVAPYGPDVYVRELGPSPRFAEESYIFVFQDVRGRFLSEGKFVEMRPEKQTHGPGEIDESTDTYDTIEWLIHNVAHNNGRVGVWGVSYDGFFAAAAAISAHPALKAVSPQAPQTDWFAGDDTHHNGAFFLVATFDFMAVHGRDRPAPTTQRAPPFKFGTPDGYAWFLSLGPIANVDANYFHGGSRGWTEMMEHGVYDDFWKTRNLLPHLRDIAPAILTVGGWYDANNFYGALHVSEAIARQSPATRNTLVVGPWSHGQWGGGYGDALGPLRFGSTTATFFQDNIELPFFEHYLKDKPDPQLPRAYVFETGTNRWRRFDQWPPAHAAKRSLYLRDHSFLSFEPSAKVSPESFDEYTSQPDRPVPFVNALTTFMNPDYMAQDQRFAAMRPDVLVYRSEVLNDDITIAGPVVPKLFVSTSGTDCDWVVKLIDVYPDDAPDSLQSAAELRNNLPRQPVRMGGFQQLVRGDVIRGKFRNGLDTPKPFRPGQVTEVDLTMPDVLHTFRKGHRIMVQIQSTWFPLVDRNPQRFVDIYHAKASDFQNSVQRVYHSASLKSRIEIFVLTN